MKYDLKRKIWVMDGGRCRNCGTAVPFDPARPPHHIKYRSQGGKDTPENLITLCLLDDYCVHNGARVDSEDNEWRPGRWIMWTMLNKLVDKPDYRWGEVHEELSGCGEVTRYEE